MRRETRSARYPPACGRACRGARPKAEGERPGDAVGQRGHRGRPPSAPDDRGVGTPASCRARSSSTDVESYRSRSARRARAPTRRCRAPRWQARRGGPRLERTPGRARRRAGTGLPPPRPCPRRTGACRSQQLAELEPAEHIVGESRDERFEPRMPIVDAIRRARLDQQSVGNRQLGEVIEVRGARRSRAVGGVEAASPVPTPEREPEGGVGGDGASVRGRRRRASDIRAQSRSPSRYARSAESDRVLTAPAPSAGTPRLRESWRSTDHVIESVSAARSSGAAVVETCAIGAPPSASTSTASARTRGPSRVRVPLSTIPAPSSRRAPVAPRGDVAAAVSAASRRIVGASTVRRSPMPFRLALNVEARSRPSRTSCVSRTLGGEREHGERRRGGRCRLRGLAARHRGDHERRGAERQRDRARRMSPNEPPARASAPSAARIQRARIEMPAYVGREGAGRRVAALRLLPQRGEHDVVEAPVSLCRSRHVSARFRSTRSWSTRSNPCRGSRITASDGGSGGCSRLRRSAMLRDGPSRR